MGISIIFPHHISEEQNRVLELNLKMIKENTVGEYEVLYLANNGRRDLVYEGWNMLAKVAKYDRLLWHNTDLLLAPGWDAPIYKSDADWICLRVVECGAIGVDGAMINADFGRMAATFHRDEFESFVKKEGVDKPDFESGFVWYCPSVLKRDRFLEAGGFNNDPPFPERAHDIDFRLKVEKLGWKFQISNHSWAYHLQRARENTGDKPERE